MLIDVELAASSLRTEKEPSSSQLPSPDEKVDGDDLEDLEQLRALLYKAEAKARILAPRQKQSAPTSLSAGSVQLLQHRNKVSGSSPVEPTGTVLSRFSIPENQTSSAAHVDELGKPPEQDAGETKGSFGSTLNLVSSSLPSATQPNPSLESAHRSVGPRSLTDLDPTAFACSWEDQIRADHRLLVRYALMTLGHNVDMPPNA